MPPRRVARLIYRLNAQGWTVDRPRRIFVVAADGSQPPRPVTTGPFEADGLTWSPDGTRIAFASGRHDTWDLDRAVDLWAVGTDGTADPERLTSGAAAHSCPSWSPDGRHIAYYVNPTPLESSRHEQLGVLDIASGTQRLLTASLDRNCLSYGLTRPPTWVGNRLLFSVEDSGNVHLYQARGDAAGQPALIAGGERWISDWDWANGTLAFVAGTPVSAGEVFATGLAGAAADQEGWPAGGGEAGRQLTNLGGAFTARVRLALPERFQATSQDGSVVECWAIPPVGAMPGRAYPTLVNVHGGPFTQYGNRFYDDFQLQASAGFGVLYCNPRGSAGYSEAWGRAVRFPECEHDPGSGWGGVDFEDVIACAREACRRFGWVDAQRLGILGGSYGGYMTSWTVGHTDMFKAACSERACNNLLTMEHSMDISGFIRSYVGRSHLDEPAAYARQSPVTYVKDMTTPLLIIHSEDDLRCPINQAEELFVALRLLGRDPLMVRFPDENHELTRNGSPAHRITRANLILDWFRGHLSEAAAQLVP
jgi:dipeptidyl aminopeptidase/acylaminoacyl peptidase